MTSARFALKAATDDLHDELDGRLAKLELADPADYLSLLKLHARALPAIEAALERGGLGEMVVDWQDHRRTGQLQSDLAALGEPMPEPAPVPAFTTPARVLGAAYVLEGSRLGSQILRESVPPGMPISFLSATPAASAWPRLVAALDRFLYSPQLLGEAVAGARACFTLYLDEARMALPE